jgi:CheY-like chemotaxis protein
MNIKLYKYIASRLREKRKKVGFKLAYMSTQIGISIKQLQEYERAEAKISASRLYQIARVLGVNPNYFFEGFDDFEKHTTLLLQTHIRPDRLRMLNILLIEDDESDVFLTRKAFQNSSINTEILVMNKSLDVFNFLKNKMTDISFPRPDIILLDLNLPKKDGISILRNIKQDPNMADIPVVILSDSTSPELVAKCYKAYASGYICKPFDFNVLANHIDIFAQYWAQAVVLPNRQLKLQNEGLM